VAAHGIRQDIHTCDPATGEETCSVAHGDVQDVERAVRGARRAFDDTDWRRLAPSHCQQLLWRIGDIFWEGAEQFTQIEDYEALAPALKYAFEEDFEFANNVAQMLADRKLETDDPKI